MKKPIVRKHRCAVYTRKSSEEGLDQEFNSLDAQREACEAYITSQKAEGWVPVRDRYDDGGFSPVFQHLSQHRFGGRLGDLPGVEQLQQTGERLNQLMLDAIRVAQQMLGEGARETPEYVIAGETNLMEFAELSNVDKLRRLFEAFTARRDILNLLDLSLRAEGVQIFIGQESGYQILDDCSLVTAPYTLDNETVGVLGVIGPTRMAYERVIPIVDITAKLLSNALTHQMND